MLTAWVARYASRNVVDYCTAVGTRRTAKPQEIEVIKLEHCGRPRSNELGPRESSHDASTVASVVTSNIIHQRVIDKINKQKTVYNKHQDTIDVQDYQAVTCT